MLVLVASTDVVRAAFDVPLDPGDRAGSRLRGAFTTAPIAVFAATTVDEVPDVVAAAEAAAAGGRWVVGGLTYEAGSAWDPAQPTHSADGELARFEVFDGEPSPWPESTPAPAVDWFPAGGFGPLTPAEAIASVQRHIVAGDCYQVNLTSRMAAPSRSDLYDRFATLADAQPGGYAVFLRGAGVASVSPELFFHSRPDGGLVTQPMKGTAPATASADDLRKSPKDRAENLMIVDLLRNDLGRVCQPGTVMVDALFELVRLPTLWQMVSTVSGLRQPGAGLVDVFAALFPCGSVTGAPKIRAMSVIRDLEPRPRGWYCGALGVLRPGGEAIFNVAIRTIEERDGWTTCGIGSGIVADSEPAAELAEWRAKTRFLGGQPLAALETMLLTDGQFPRLERHLHRLARTDAKLGLGIDLAAARDRLAQVAAEFPSGRWRVRLTAREDDVSVEVTEPVETTVPVPLAIATEPLDVEALRPVIEHKTTWRAHYDRLRGMAPDGVFDVICHTPDGVVTETTLGNLALELDGRWVTPPAMAGLLPGVERAHWLAQGGLVEAEVTLADLRRATDLALLNGVRGWLPAVLVDDEPRRPATGHDVAGRARTDSSSAG